MIFQQWQQVLDGTKTQTRRCYKHGEYLVMRYGDSGTVTVNFAPIFETTTGEERLFMTGDGLINKVLTPSKRLKVEVGRDYPIIPKRGVAQVGRYKVTRIRVERLQWISPADALMEGVGSVDQYRDLWESINGKVDGRTWFDNPVVLVYDFERVTP